MLTEISEVKYVRYMRSHNSGIVTVKFCIFERSNKKNNFSKTKIYFHKKNYAIIIKTCWLQYIKVGVKSNFGRLARIFQICAMDADILS